MREDWIEIEINEVANLYQPKTISSKMLVAGGKYPVYGANGIIGNYDHYNHENEEFLITCRGATCGNVHITQPFSWINGNAMVVQPYNKSLLSLEYLRFVFSNKGRVQKAISGSAQPQITRTTLSPIKIPLSPLPEQRAIVAKIEELFSDLDKGIADLKKAQDQLKVYRQAVLKKAFEGDWEKIPLESISEAIGGNAFKSKTFLKEKAKYQIIRIGNIRPGVTRYDASPVYINDVDDKTLNKYLLKKGDLVITLTGTRNKRDYGFTALVDTDNLLLNQRLAYLRFKDGYLSKFYLYFSWSEPFKVQFFGSETGNVGQGNVGMKSVRQTLVPLLSKEEQHQIVREIESRLSVCDKVEQSISESLEKALGLRQSILKKAFEGTLLSIEEIAACKAAPDYEPASVLLEKIKEEKSSANVSASKGKKKK